MADKAQEKKQEIKQGALGTKESKVKVMAKSNSGAGTTLNVNIEGVPKVIIHGEMLEVNEMQLQKLKISSSSWSYDQVEKGETK